MKIGEVIQRVQSLYSKGVNSDDSRLSNRHIYNKLLTARSLLIKQSQSQKETVGENTYSIIDCMELIYVPAHNCPCLPQVGCKVLRTKYQIPNIIESKSGMLIDYVSTLDSHRIFSITNKLAYNYEKFDRFFSQDKVIIENNYIYVYGNNLPNYIKIRAVFSDFITNLNYCTGKENHPSYSGQSDLNEICEECGPCISNLDKEFKIKDSLLEPCIRLTQEELVREFSAMIEDLSNDNKDSNIEQSK